jgi:hypothetical protein
VLSLRGEGLTPVVVGPGRSERLILGGLQQTLDCRLGCRRKKLPGLDEPYHLAATSVTAVASSQLAPSTRESE